MPRIRIGDADIHYEDAGRGPVVFLLHAFPLHSGMWRPQIDLLAREHRVIAMDYRGLGRSGPAPEVATMELLASDAAELLARLGVAHATVAGLSMGGYVALALYRKSPQLFRGLVLCDTRAGPDSAEGREGRHRFAQDALAKGMGWVADQMIPKLLGPNAAEEVVKRVRALIGENDPRGVAAAQRGMAARPDSEPLLKQVRCPTLVMVGSEDSLTPPSISEEMAATLGARLALLPGAGHLANLESPKLFAGELACFIAGLETPRRAQPPPLQ
ncbi:alpha/beta fold hydrolase [Anaeromyxobacter paludicola]|uniref:Alpha/beta hydrolase n=1 Tax=Anaeromyxobacter paludicola TaxID=2918171 RepID=A0ABM7XEC1_9BACT|nr:alpha/beta fold hydrolase [Anaeromyxobacter paludicola]BDG10231.1 alpha/beta hydrolase [Anaeromyxobacter paludicola]